jgi:hypothetical protein
MTLHAGHSAVCNIEVSFFPGYASRADESTEQYRLVRAFVILGDGRRVQGNAVEVYDGFLGID